MDWGAPSPVIAGDEHTLLVAYYLQDNPEDWDGSRARTRDPQNDLSPMVLFRLTGVSFFCQRGNDRNHNCAFVDYSGEDLSKSHEVWEVSKSELLKREGLTDRGVKHLIFAFHDTSLECICENYSFDITFATAATVFDAVTM